MRSWRLLLLLMAAILLPAVEALAKTCDLGTLTNNCQLFRDLGPNDVIEFEDGTRVPSCALSSSSQTIEEQQERELKPQLATLAEVFSTANMAGVSEREARDWMNGRNLATRELDPPQAKKMYWPPGSDSAEFRVVTPEEARAFWTARFGAEGYRKVLSTYRELDRISAKFSELRHPRDQQQFDFSQQQARSERLFNEAKSAVERKILAGRKESALSANEREILDRVRMVRNREGQLQQFGCGVPFGAGFDYGELDVSVPPGLMFQPDESILRVMTHEISHAFDLCRLSGGVDGDTLAKRFPRAPGTLEQTPFFETYRCLRANPGGGFRGPKETASAPDSGTACYPNHHNEAFCDWFAAETMSTEMKLRDRSPNGPMPTALAKRSGRTVKLSNAMKPIFLQLDYACNTSEGERYEQTGQHPSWGDRLDKIMLRQPKLTEGLGCEAAPGRCAYPATPSREIPSTGTEGGPAQSGPGVN